MVGETGLFTIDPRHAMRSDEFQRIMDADQLCVMPVKANARHGHLDDFGVKGVVIAVGFIPEMWSQEEPPHYIPHAVAMMHQAAGVIEKTNVAAFCMLHNLANMLTMAGREVAYTARPMPGAKPLDVRSPIYSPISPPEAFQVVTISHGIVDHLGQKIMEDAAPGFAEHLKHKDQQRYNDMRSLIRNTTR
jgi:hypothetical protein